IDLGDRRSRVQISAARQKAIPLSRLGGHSGSRAGRALPERRSRSGPRSPTLSRLARTGFGEFSCSDNPYCATM
ncbi:uncharacterized protein METZ01_LOCUS332848, partial [marine metagenome]